VQEARAILVPAPVFPLIVTGGSPLELNDRIEIWLNEGGAGGEVNR
jgi:hypothetical protein